MNWLANNYELLGRLAWNHIWLCLPALAAALLVSIPLGWWANRVPKIRPLVLSTASIFYALPSLALFVVLPIILGTRILDPLNVIVAMSLYGVAILVRTVVDAFGAIPVEVRSSALAVGHSRSQMFWLVELPLAGPTILAGLRVVSAATISLVSVGALVGVSSLGLLFTDGFARNYGFEILVGLIATLILAGVFDLVLLGFGRLLLPWTRRVRQ